MALVLLAHGLDIPIIHWPSLAFTDWTTVRLALGKTPNEGASVRLGSTMVAQPHFYLPTHTVFTDSRHRPQELSIDKRLYGECEFSAQDHLKNLFDRSSGFERTRVTVFDVILVGP